MSVTLNGVSVAGGQILGSDSFGGNEYQVVKLGYSIAGAAPVQVSTTNPLPIQGPIGSFSANAGNPVKVAGVFNAAAPTVTSGQISDLQVDANGFLKVNIAAGAAAGGTSSTFGAAVPAVGTAIGASDGTNMQLLQVDGSKNLKVNIAAGGVPAGQDNTSFTASTTQGLPMIAVADNTNAVGAVTQGNQGVPKMSLGRQLYVAPQANVVGGWAPTKIIAAASNNATVVKSSPGSLGTVLAINLTASIVFLKFYNKATAPAPASDTPVWTIPIPANTSGAGVSHSIPAGLAFSLGIGVAIVANLSDTDNTSVAANCAVVNIGYI